MVEFFRKLSSPTYDNVVVGDYEFPEDPKGFAGVRRIFTLDQYGNPSEELTTVIHMSTMSVLSGMFIGAFLHGRKSWLDFMENNQATLFANHIEAKKQLQDTVMLHMGRGAMKWGWRVGGFSCLFLTTNTIITAYRGQPGIIDYIGAGAITGGLFRANLGIKGFISGAVVGTFLGTIAGATSLALLSLSGLTMKDIQRTQKEFKDARDARIFEERRKQCEEEFEIIKAESEKTGTLDQLGTEK